MFHLLCMKCWCDCHEQPRPRRTIVRDEEFAVWVIRVVIYCRVCAVLESN